MVSDSIYMMENYLDKAKVPAQQKKRVLCTEISGWFPHWAEGQGHPEWEVEEKDGDGQVNLRVSWSTRDLSHQPSCLCYLSL
jgi:hypothetical protein